MSTPAAIAIAAAWLIDRLTTHTIRAIQARRAAAARAARKATP